MPFKKIEVGFQTSTLPQTPYMAYGKDKYWKNWILFLQWSKCIPINLKGKLKTFNGQFEGFYITHSSQMWKITILDQKQPFET